MVWLHVASISALLLLLLSSADGSGEATFSSSSSSSSCLRASCPAGTDRCRRVSGATWCYCRKGATLGECREWTC